MGTSPQPSSNNGRTNEKLRAKQESNLGRKLVINKPQHHMEIWGGLGVLKLASARQRAALRQGSGCGMYVANASISVPLALLLAALHFMYRHLAFLCRGARLDP